MAAYETTLEVRFGDIDHAGIVYYPRFLHYLHVAYEEFLVDRVGIPLHVLLDARRIGFPAVKAEIDFSSPLRCGDTARVAIDVVRLGVSSVTMRYRIRKNGEDAVATEGRITTVCVGMDDFRPRPIPDDVRAVLEDHQAG